MAPSVGLLSFVSHPRLSPDIAQARLCCVDYLETGFGWPSCFICFLAHLNCYTALLMRLYGVGNLAHIVEVKNVVHFMDSLSTSSFHSTYSLHLLDISCKLYLVEKQFSRNVALFLSVSSHSYQAYNANLRTRHIYNIMCVTAYHYKQTPFMQPQNSSSDIGGRSICPGKSLETTSRTATVM